LRLGRDCAYVTAEKGRNGEEGSFVSVVHVIGLPRIGISEGRCGIRGQIKQRT